MTLIILVYYDILYVDLSRTQVHMAAIRVRVTNHRIN